MLNSYDDVLKNLEEVTNKIPSVPSTQISVDISVNNFEQAQKIVEKFCAEHDGKHKLSISLKFN